MDDLGRYAKGKSGRDPLELTCTEPGTGLVFVELNHPWGHGAPTWPGDGDVRIDRAVTHARDGVYSQKITATMHVSTHLNAPINLVQQGGDIANLPIDRFFGNGCVLGIPKARWDLITADDLAKASPAVRPGDIVIINTGWHKKYSDSQDYFACAPGLAKDGAQWLIARNIKLFGIDTASVDHPMATSLAAHRNGPLLPRLPKYYADQTGRDPRRDFPEWNPAHRALLAAGIPTIENVGGGLDRVTGQRCTFHAYPWKFRDGDACVVRLVALLDPAQRYRIARGNQA